MSVEEQYRWCGRRIIELPFRHLSPSTRAPCFPRSQLGGMSVVCSADVCMGRRRSSVLVPNHRRCRCPLHLPYLRDHSLLPSASPLLHASRSFSHPHFSFELGSSLLVVGCTLQHLSSCHDTKPIRPRQPKFPQFPNARSLTGRFSSLTFLHECRVDHSTSRSWSVYVHAEGGWGGCVYLDDEGRG